MSQYVCPWCNTTSDAPATCPACGAAVDIRAVASKAGWQKMPGAKDMARIQCGASSCQIAGTYVPIVDFNLAPGDSVYFTHHVILFADTKVKIAAMSLKGAWKRMFAGLPLVMTQAEGPGHIAFSHDKPGEIVTVPLHPGLSIDVREHVFLAATHAVQYDWFDPNIWYRIVTGRDDNGNQETETRYPVGLLMDRFHAPEAPGLLLLQAGGNVLMRILGPGETMLIKPTSLLFKDSTVGATLHFEYPDGGWYSSYLWIRLTGPGRVAVESAFAHMEDPGSNLLDCSPASQSRW
ncbi:MAG TPA: AIM24 family protein [Candidatus Xenobia bacterium]|jgi:uncharacterized protein (AIM24 family)